MTLAHGVHMCAMQAEVQQAQHPAAASAPRAIRRRDRRVDYRETSDSDQQPESPQRAGRQQVNVYRRKVRRERHNGDRGTDTMASEGPHTGVDEPWQSEVHNAAHATDTGPETGGHEYAPWQYEMQVNLDNMGAVETDSNDAGIDVSYGDDLGVYDWQEEVGLGDDSYHGGGGALGDQGEGPAGTGETAVKDMIQSMDRGSRGTANNVQMPVREAHGVRGHGAWGAQAGAGLGTSTAQRGQKRTQNAHSFGTSSVQDGAKRLQRSQCSVRTWRDPDHKDIDFDIMPCDDVWD